MQLAAPGRRAILVSAVLTSGLLSVAVTEIENVVHTFNIWVVSLLWSFAAVVFVALALRVKLMLRDRSPVDALSAVLIAASLAIGVAVAVTAWFSPPNTYDVLAYHFPRIIYWIQNASLAVFPSPYPLQNFMPPFAEYVQLQLYVLSGGDRLPNCVQSLAFFGLICVVSLIAQELGAKIRGQAIACLTTATISFAILEASGAKNDVVATFWLATMTWFVLRYARRVRNVDAIGASASFALALLTKGTAFILGPPLLLAALFAAWRTSRRELAKLAAIMAIFVIGVNAPFQLRIFRKPGARSAFLVNSSHGVRPTASNMIRMAASLMGTWSQPVNEQIFRAALFMHRAMHQDANDRATTLGDNRFDAPGMSLHEGSASDLPHILLLLLATPAAAWIAFRTRSIRLLLLCAGVPVAFVAFCAVFKYSPYTPRLLMPLLAIDAAIVGLVSEKLLPAVAQAGLVILLVCSAAPYVFANSERPLLGEKSVLSTSRENNYFRVPQLAPLEEQYKTAENFILNRGCEDVGIDYFRFPLEYPLMQDLRARSREIRFFHPAVGRDRRVRLSGKDCAVVCLDCGERPGFRQRYRDFQALYLDPLVVYWSTDKLPSRYVAGPVSRSHLAAPWQ